MRGARAQPPCGRHAGDGADEPGKHEYPVSAVTVSDVGLTFLFKYLSLLEYFYNEGVVTVFFFFLIKRKTGR